MKKWFSLLSVSLFLVSCDHDSPDSPDKNPSVGTSPTGDQLRPGQDSIQNLEAELLDTIPRFTSQSLKLSYDIPGTLFQQDNSGATDIRNLNNEDHVHFSHSQVREDSLCTGKLIINDIPSRITSLKRIKTTEKINYYLISTEKEPNILLVIEE